MNYQSLNVQNFLQRVPADISDLRISDINNLENLRDQRGKTYRITCVRRVCWQVQNGKAAKFD